MFLCNAGEIWAMLAWHLWQPIIKKLLVQSKNCWKSDKNALSLFLCNVVWSLLGNIEQGFYLCNVVPRVVLWQHWTGFFHVQYCLRFLPALYWVSRQLWTGFFPVQFSGASWAPLTTWQLTGNLYEEIDLHNSVSIMHMNIV